MFNGRRWTWLGLLAAGNLALWVGIACFVGLCASDEVDLGVETMVRHAQATALCSWEEMRGGDVSGTAGEVSPSTLPPRVRTQGGESGVLLALATVEMSEASLEENASPTVPAPATTRPSNGDGLSTFDVPSIDETSSAPVLSPPAAGNPETTARPPERDPGVEAGPTATADPARATPGIAADIVSAPLLLVDPEFHTLAALNSEMERSASGRPVQIRYQEEALNQELATLWLNNPDLPYRDVKVDFQDNGVAISGQVTVLGFQVEAHLQGTVVARDCRPQLEVESVSLAGIMAPRFVRARVVTMAQESMDWYPAGYPLCLEQIVLEETRATFYGHHR